MRAMVATVTLSGVLAAALGVAVVTAATAQDADEPAPPAASDGQLVDALVELERQLPTLPPSGVDLGEEDDTYGSLQGDFLGARTELEFISDQARQLFVQADDADGPVAEAVSSVARSYLRLEQAFAYLARDEEHDLDRPLGATDDDGVATGADPAAGYVETGLDLVELARMDALMGYAVLRDTEAADDTEKALFDAAYRSTRQYLTELRPDARKLVSASSTAVLLAVERFEGAGAGEARAKDVTYVCIPREQYPADSPDPLASLTELLGAGELDLLPTADCPDLPSNENEVASRTR